MTEAGPPAAGNRGASRVKEPTRAQRTVARRAAESRATIPAFECSIEATLVGQGDLTALLLESLAQAVRKVPKANATYRDGRFELYERVNIGLVVPTEEALSIPVVFDADRKSRAELADEARRLTDRARAGTVTAPELSGATITLFAAAEFGVSSVSPLVVPPHAAAVGAGAPRPSGQHREITVTLAADHRILYGLEAFHFLSAIKEAAERS